MAAKSKGVKPKAHKVMSASGKPLKKKGKAPARKHVAKRKPSIRILTQSEKKAKEAVGAEKHSKRILEIAKELESYIGYDKRNSVLKKKNHKKNVETRKNTKIRVKFERSAKSARPKKKK